MYVKKIMSLFLSLILVFGMMSIPILAASKPLEGEAVPYWQNIATMKAKCSISQNNVKISANVSSTKVGASIDGTLYLEEKNGNTWNEVTSWSFQGTDIVSLQKTYPYSNGKTYRSKVEVYVDGEYAVSYSSQVKK